MPVTTIGSEDALYGDEQELLNEEPEQDFDSKIRASINQSDEFDDDEIVKESDIKEETFDDYLAANRKSLLSQKRSDMTTTAINGFPTSLERVIAGISFHFKIKQFVIEDALIRFGLERLYYYEIRSFGLIKKIKLLNRLTKYIEMPVSKSNKLEILGEKCTVCKRVMCESESTMSFFMRVKMLLDIGSTDLSIICILLSLENSEYIRKQQRWVYKDYKLRREKQGLKIVKTKNLFIRERLRFFGHEISRIIACQKSDDEEVVDHDMTDEDMAELREIRDTIQQMRLKRGIV